MAHKFHPDNKSKLNSEERRKILPPEQVLSEFGLTQGDIVADVGCGIGFFSLPAVEFVGEQGKVYALDISSDMIETLQQKKEQKQLNNLIPMVTEENNLKLSEHTATFALLSTVLHEAENLHEFLAETKRILQPGGKIAIIEWKYQQTEKGPPIDHRLSPEQINKMLEELNFLGIRSCDFNDNFYTVSARKY